jgi:tetratricopeptide (TPR) repeat protein
MRWFERYGWALAAGSVVLGASAPAESLTTDQAKERAKGAVESVEADMGTIQASVARSERVRTTADQRIAEGELSLRAKDHEQAIYLFNQAAGLYREGQASPSANADALFLLGESYFEDGQFLSAGRQYKEVLDRASEPAYAPYAGRSMSRLVDVNVRADRPEALEGMKEYLNRLPQSDAIGSLEYARGKLLLTKQDLPGAARVLGSVPATSPYHMQAQYLLGVLLTREARSAISAASTPASEPAASTGAAPATPSRVRFAAALEQFRKVTRLTASNDAHRHVVDLAWMAIGRLLYETDNHTDAIDAYSHIDRASAEFSTMLYELAWVFVGLKDYQRAQRALEVLAVTDPDRPELSDSSLLRADLLLRSGQFENALKAYRGVRSRHQPIRQELDEFLAKATDPGEYYDALVREEAAGAGQGLAPLALKWAQEQAEDTRAFAAIDDINRSRDLVKKSRRLAVRLDSVLASPVRVKAFPELKSSLESTLGLLNHLTVGRVALAEGMDSVAEVQGSEHAPSGAHPGKLLETDPGTLGRELSAMKSQVDELQRLADTARGGIQGGRVKDAGHRTRLSAQLEVEQGDIERYRSLIAQYEATLSQAGPGVVAELDELVVRGSLPEVRAARRALMQRLSWLPVTPGDFSRRDAAAERQWNDVSQTLQRLTLESDRLQAMVNGLRRVLKDADQFGVAKDPASRERFAAEIEANERDLADYRARIRDYREAVELGRAQVGFGDQRFVEDETSRRRFRALFARELQLVASGQDSKSAAEYGGSIAPLMDRIANLEARLEGVEERLEQSASERAGVLREKVGQELAQIEVFSNRLDALDQEARLLVGEAAMRSFVQARGRLKDIVTKADIGIVQQAWEVREEERLRVRNLLRERAREDRKLNDEIREVLDDTDETR